MGLSINLRGDLAKLDDDELAARLKAAWARYEVVDKPRKSWWSRWTLLGARGPIKHPRAYRFVAALQGSGGDPWVGALFALLASQKRAEGFVRQMDRDASMHIDLCEIHDLVEEVERRIDQRKVVAT